MVISVISVVISVELSVILVMISVMSVVISVIPVNRHTGQFGTHTERLYSLSHLSLVKHSF